jgi:sugar porter (SP) family MFS transporter
MQEVTFNVYRGFIFFALGGLLFGYSIGVNSNVLAKGQLQCCRPGNPCTPTDAPGAGLFDFGYDMCYDFTALEVGFVSSLSLFGALLGSLLCFNLADVLGRKREALLGAVCYVAGAAIVGLAPMLAVVFLGLFVYGVGIGFAMHAAPLYIAEITPAQVRGSFISGKEVIIVLGIFLGFAVGAICSTWQTIGWRFMFGFAGLLGLVMGGGVAALPRSPRWLAFRAARQRDEGALLGQSWETEAKAALEFFRTKSSPNEIADELNRIFEDARASCSGTVARCTDSFSYPRPLLIGIGMVVLQQVTGQPSVLYFANTIFESAGFANSAALSSTGVGLVKLVATTVTVFRVDKYGRRILLQVGIAVMLVALILVGIGFVNRTCRVPVPISECALADVALPSSWAIVVVAALMLYVTGYQIGFGPIVWLLISEIFPLRVRGAAMSLAVAMNFSTNILGTFSLTYLLQALSPPGVFFLYAALTVVALIFVTVSVPETKGKTLEEIETMMAPKRSRDVGQQLAGRL